MTEEGIPKDVLSRIVDLSSDKITNSEYKKDYYDKGVEEGVKTSANKLIESGMSIEDVCKSLDISEDDLR